MKKALLILPIALFVVGWIWLVHRPSEVERAVRSAAEAGAFPIAGVGSMYNGEVDCRVEEVGAVHGQDLYVCKLGLEGLDAPGGQYVYAAMVDGSLYTHATNPNLIPARVLDPSF